MKPLEHYDFEMSLGVRDYEVDSQGIVNNAVYLHYMEHTRHEFCREAGASFREMQEHGIDPVVRHIEVEYISSLGLGETMVSKLSLERKGPRFIFVQDIFHADGLSPVVHGVVTIVSLENGRLSRGDAMAEAFSQFFTGKDRG